jgi:hypothetical protein
VGSLDRRLANLEALLSTMGGTNDFEEWVSTEALALLPTPELRLVVTGLRRVRERYAGMPPDTPIPAAVYEELLSQEELGALVHLQELRAELRGEAG